MNLKSMVVSAMLLLGCVIGMPAVASNPVDGAGLQHNEFLRCLEKHAPPDTELLVSLVKDCGYDPGMPLDTFVKTYTPVFDIQPGTLTTSLMEPYRNQYTDYEFSFFVRMDDIFSTSPSIEQMKERLATLEHEAIERLDPEKRTNRTILGGISVARHSADHWSGKVDEQPNSAAARIPWIIRIIVTVLADVAAYLATDSGTVAAAVSKYVWNLLGKL